MFISLAMMLWVFTSLISTLLLRVFISLLIIQMLWVFTSLLITLLLCVLILLHSFEMYINYNAQ